jgi:hypothetical protein
VTGFFGGTFILLKEPPRNHPSRFGGPRRSAIEPVIGHMKAEGHLGRCYLKGRVGDAANAILCAVGYNFRRILA